LPAAAPAAPQVLPALVDDKTATGPEVLPALVDDKTANGPEVLPVLVDDKTAIGPEVLPAQVVDKTATGPEVLPRASDEKGLNHGPQTLPTVDDGFILTGKFDDGPPVMPTLMDGFDSDLGLTGDAALTPEFLMTLGLENPLHLRAPGDSLMLADDWSGIISRPQDEIWS
jgi:hypothetical protein